MKGPLTVRVDGLRELDARLGNLTKATARGVLRRVLLKAGRPMADTAARLAPDDPETGPPDLHTSIDVSQRVRNNVGGKEYSDTLALGGSKAEAVQAMRDARRGAAGGSFAEVYVGPTNAEKSKRAAIKAIVQEFGSVNQPAQPYLRPAFDQEAGNALQIIRKELGAEIDKAVSRAAKRAAKKVGA